MNIAEKLTVIAENEPKVYDAGKSAEYESFWENALKDKQNTSFEYTFADMVWNDYTLNIPEKYLPLTPTSVNYPFRYCSATILPSVDYRGCGSTKTAYAYARSAITIGTVILREDGTNVFSSTFSYCDDLENITFAGCIGTSISFSSSKNLTSESINNIIEHLADLTGKTAQTITFHATVGNKLSDIQKTAIQNKNWDLAY